MPKTLKQEVCDAIDALASEIVAVSHEIHADRPDQGFGHGNQPIPANSFDPVVRQVNTPGTYDYYPHDIGQSIPGRIVIE